MTTLLMVLYTLNELYADKMNKKSSVTLFYLKCYINFVLTPTNSYKLKSKSINSRLLTTLFLFVSLSRSFSSGNLNV